MTLMKYLERCIVIQSHEVRTVFLDISKAFDKVWHESLLYKLKSMGISGEFHNLLENYLSSKDLSDSKG